MIVASINDHVEAGGSVPFRLSEPAFELGAEPKQNSFDMLARAKAVNPKIHAIAGKLAFIYIADFNRVGPATPGFDMEIREDWVPRISIRDAEAIPSLSQSAATDPIQVCLTPVMNR